jgi:UrcA family protein
MRHTPLVAAASLALALGCAAAQSAAAQDLDPLTIYGHRPAPGSRIVSVVVPYNDLNLTSYAGADVMLGRIRSAAKTICGTESANPMDRATIWRPCVEDITWRAVDDFNHPIVAELNDRRTGGYPVYDRAYEADYVASNGY